MIRRPPPQPRAGAIVPMVAILIVFLMAMVAFAIDIGYIAVVQKELQNAADAAALAGTAKLVRDRSALTGTLTTTTLAASARAEAQLFSSKNHGGGVPLNLANNGQNAKTGDVVCGFLINPSDLTQSLDTSGGKFNSVQVRVRRTAQQNGALPLFFGPILGRDRQDVQATATATYEGGTLIIGFSMPPGSPRTAPLLPFTIDVDSWGKVTSGTGPDNWVYNPISQKVSTATTAGDGIKEINLYPQKGISPGSFGTVDLGNPNNSSADISRQIRYGLNANDFSYFPDNQIKLDTNGQLQLQGDTGISAGFKDDLAAIVGQPRIIPIFKPPATGTGNRTTYTIVGFGGIIITQVKMTGMVKQLTIQPEFVFEPTAISGGNGNTESAFVYRPLRLTR